MALIRRVVEDTIATGYLTQQTEERLRRLFAQGCDLGDLDALTQLQEAISTGAVQRFATPGQKEIAACRAEARSPY